MSKNSEIAVKDDAPVFSYNGEHKMTKAKLIFGKPVLEDSTGTEDESLGLLPMEADSDTSVDIKVSKSNGNTGNLSRHNRIISNNYNYDKKSLSDISEKSGSMISKKSRAISSSKDDILRNLEDPFSSSGKKNKSFDLLNKMLSASGYCGYDSPEPFYACQSCQAPTRTPSTIPINLHHYVDSFYSTDATEASNVDSIIPGHSMAHAFNTGLKGMVSVKPTTAAIPLEAVILCEVCASLFRLHRLQCDACYYVPRIDQKLMKDCMHCFEGVVTRH